MDNKIIGHEGRAKIRSISEIIRKNKLVQKTTERSRDHINEEINKIKFNLFELHACRRTRKVLLCVVSVSMSLFVADSDHV